MGLGCVGGLCRWLTNRQVGSSGTHKKSVGTSAPSASRELSGGEVELTNAAHKAPVLQPPEVKEQVSQGEVEDSADEGVEDKIQEVKLPSVVAEENLEEVQEEENKEGVKREDSQELSGGSGHACGLLEESEEDSRTSWVVESAKEIEEEVGGPGTGEKTIKKGGSLLSMFRKPPRSGNHSDGGDTGRIAIYEALAVSADEAQEKSPEGTGRRPQGDEEVGVAKGQGLGFVLPKGRIKKSPSFAGFQWRIKSRKQPGSPHSGSEEDSSLVDRQLSTSSAPAGGSEHGQDIALAGRHRGFACFRWGQPLSLNEDDDEQIVQYSKLDEDLTPPGLVGLSNLGNTCFLNAALQCLRCTPGLAELLVPEFKNGFSSKVSIALSEDNGSSCACTSSKRSLSLPSDLDSILNRPQVAAALEARTSSTTWTEIPHQLWDEPCNAPADAPIERGNSLPVDLPSLVATQLPMEDTGLMGGSSVKPVCPNEMWQTARDEVEAGKQQRNSFSVFADFQSEGKKESSKDKAACLPAQSSWISQPKNHIQSDIQPSYVKVDIHVIEDLRDLRDVGEAPESSDRLDSHTTSGISIGDGIIPRVKPVGNNKEDGAMKKQQNSSISRSAAPVDGGKGRGIESCGDLGDPLKTSCNLGSQAANATSHRVVRVTIEEVDSKKRDGIEGENRMEEMLVADNRQGPDSGEVKLLRMSATSDATEIGDPRDFGKNFILAFQKTIVATCTMPPESHFNPKSLYKRLGTLPQGEFFCDGGQHDCQETIEALLNLVHDQLNCAEPRDCSSPEIDDGTSDDDSDKKEKMGDEEREVLKAEDVWTRYLQRDCSPITDLFAGLLQIVRTCQKCSFRTTTYEPFWGLSLPLAKEKSGWFGGRGPNNIDDLLRAFTAGEVLQGDEGPFCEGCNQKCNATRRIRIHRFPPVLILNIKRFKYTKDGREKLTSNIAYPTRGLKLQNYASRESKHMSTGPVVYDLYASSNHFGTLMGGHYTAYCKVKDPSSKESWYCFNDQNVKKMNEDDVVTPNAYVLFYARRR